MSTVTINIKYGERCPECRKDAGLCANGLCMGCTSKAMDPAARMKSTQGRAVQKRSAHIFAHFAEERTP